MNHVGLAIGGLAALSGAAVYAAAKPAPVTPAAAFSERFPAEQPHILKKQDRLIAVKTVAVAAVDIVDAGRINTVDLTAPPEPDLTSAQDDPTPAPRRLKHNERNERDERNVCTRHHLRKVITRGGKSWRCRR